MLLPSCLQGQKGIYVSFLTDLVKFYNCIILLQQKNHNAVINCCHIGVYRCLGVCIPIGMISDRLGGLWYRGGIAMYKRHCIISEELRYFQSWNGKLFGQRDAGCIRCTRRMDFVQVEVSFLPTIYPLEIEASKSEHDTHSDSYMPIQSAQLDTSPE